MKHLVFTRDTFWILKPNFKSIQLTFENFTLGYNATSLSYFLGSIVFTILFIIGFFQNKKYKHNLTLLILFIFVPIISSFLISQRMSIYIDRQNMAVSAFYYIVIAAGFMAIRNKLIPKIILGIAIVILPSLSLYNYYTNYMPLGYGENHSAGICPKKDFKEPVNYLKKNIRTGDIIAFTHPGIEIPIKYYFNCRYPVPAYYFIFYDKEEEYYQKLTLVDLTQKLDQNNFHRIWLISSSWMREGDLVNNSLAVKEFMEKHYKKLQERKFDGLFIELYEN